MTNSRPTLPPFENESSVLTIGGLTLENRTDRVSIYGSLDLTRDKVGLELARTLKANLDAVVTKLESEHLPEKIGQASVVKVDNPFKE